MIKHNISKLLLALAFIGTASAQDTAFEEQVAEYIKKFPYQDTYNYAVKDTGGDPARLNTWSFGEEPVLVKAGEDNIVRMNNDTYYKFAYALLDQGPVTFESKDPSTDRFNSFQLMDDRNVNFKNLIYPNGTFVLYHGDKPSGVEGKLIESPSALVAVIVRVEVKDKDNENDVAAAENTFRGITISGPTIETFPKLDLLNGFDEKVVKEAERRMEEVFTTTDFSELVAGADDVPDRVSYLQLAAGTKFGWGGPVTSHSAYESFFTDASGNEMKGANGTYTITTEAPPVDAFWSVTVYDTDSGRLHPNKYNRYHINNTSAVADGDSTYTFTFKTECEPEEINCLEVPEGRFDLATRYYLPQETITSGKWRMAKPVLK